MSFSICLKLYVAMFYVISEKKKLLFLLLAEVLLFI